MKIAQSIVVVMLLTSILACSREKPASAAAPADSTSNSPMDSKATPKASPADNRAATLPQTAALAHFNGAAALQYTRDVVAFGPRPAGSAAHTKMESYLRAQLKSDQVQEDAFTATTPAGFKQMRNFIVKFPGTKDGIIVICGHYDTKPLKDFVGANDGGSSTGMLLELAKEVGPQLKNGKLDGYSVWLAFLDGEEAFKEWTATDSLYGSRHLAEKWNADGTLKNIKALLLVDMVGDADLDILRDSNSTPWLEDLIQQAATRLGYQSHFFNAEGAMEDDHMPFVQRGVPVADLIDFTYGYNNAYWHTPEDTMDKLSAQSFEIVGSVVLETVKLINAR